MRGWAERERIETDRALAAAWHAAHLSRVPAKKFPRLEALLSRPERAADESDPHAEARQIRALFAALPGVKIVDRRAEGGKEDSWPSKS